MLAASFFVYDMRTELNLFQNNVRSQIEESKVIDIQDPTAFLEDCGCSKSGLKKNPNLFYQFRIMNSKERDNLSLKYVGKIGPNHLFVSKEENCYFSEANNGDKEIPCVTAIIQDGRLEALIANGEPYVFKEYKLLHEQDLLLKDWGNKNNVPTLANMMKNYIFKDSSSNL